MYLGNHFIIVTFCNRIASCAFLREIQQID